MNLVGFLYAKHLMCPRELPQYSVFLDGVPISLLDGSLQSVNNFVYKGGAPISLLDGSLQSV